MYSLPLLSATALVVFGGRALIQVARAWVVRHPSAFQHTVFPFHKSHGSKKKAA